VLGETRAAELALTIAAGLAPESAGLRLHRAECRLRLGDRSEARKDLLAALELAEQAEKNTLAERAGRALARLAQPMPGEG